MRSGFLKYLFIFVLAGLAGILQIVVLPTIHLNLPLIINIPLLLFTIIIFFVNFEEAILSAFIFGIFLDFYSHLFFGFFILLFVIEVFILKFFIHNIIQNKNINSLVIANLISVILWQFIYYLPISLNMKFRNEDISYFISWSYYFNILLQFFCHSIIIVLLVKIIPFLKKQLKPTIIDL